jgi:sterol 3beta-glucosyltransferase
MKIAVVAIGTRGDVQPHLALASTLQARGHSVSIAAPLDFEDAVRELGLTYRPIGFSMRALLTSDEGAALLECGRRPLRFLYLARKVALPIVEQIVAHVDEACGASDAVCYSLLGLSAHFSAHARGVPCFPSSMQPLGRTSAFPSPLLPLNGHTPTFLNRSTHIAIEQAFWRAFRPFIRRTLKVPLPVWNHFSDLYAAETPMLFAFSPLVVPRPADWGPWMHATGYWTLPEDPAWTPPASLVDFLASGAPPVCVGFGSMHTPRVVALLPAALAAIRKQRRRAIVLTGWSGDLLDRSRLGDDVYVTDAVPHGWLFPQVVAVIHHGGAGTTAAACRAGVPSIILPFFFDQTFWGYAVHQRALAPAPIASTRVSEESLSEALQTALTSTTLREHLRTLSVGLQGEDGAGTAADVIERAMSRQ